MRSQYFYRLFASACLGVGVYCALSVIAGPAGLIAYRGLEARRDAMQVNLDALGTRNAALQSDLDSLRNDPGRAAREARALGYLAEGELSLVIEGQTVPPGENRLEPGNILKMEAPVPLGDATIKDLSLAAALLALVLSLSNDLSRNARVARRGQSRETGNGTDRETRRGTVLVPSDGRRPAKAGILGGLGA